MAALIWLIAAIVLMVAEVLSGDLVLLMLGGGALFAAGSAALSDNVFIDVGVFAVASVGLLVLARPALKRRFFAGDKVPMHTEALIGTTAVALSTVDDNGGQVKLGGDVWSARSFAEGQVIEAGAQVTVVEISGATALVTEP